MIIPDGITPEIGWRAWSVQEGMLMSMNHTPWPLKRALQAQCTQHSARQQWVPSRYGPVVPLGRTELVREEGPTLIREWGYTYDTGGLPPLNGPQPYPPKTQLPRGWGYKIETLPFECPDELCTCGIYSLKSRAHLLTSAYTNRADAVGSVSLWGKIIPAENGYRAQYAYPLVIFSDLKLEDYGVEVAPTRELGRDLSVQLQRKGRM